MLLAIRPWFGRASSLNRNIWYRARSRSRQSSWGPRWSSVWKAVATRLVTMSMYSVSSTAATLFCRFCRRLRRSWNSASSVCSSSTPQLDVSS